ncbi:WG repeat-containing protein [Flavobacterium sp. MFBS3-15]|uniref:WG repeat-containing protein n=1 Tax=Flavobacterium sp. MFBS3-15 TaxID=2989816 RepID=UPI0022357EC8|nr:WG repeat-containing protein [Flavobacterium sp. MFBS3-15]MCW4469299.1 WG repeat-containing protein [Flavobacterium sp. MFBS3-15]
MAKFLFFALFCIANALAQSNDVYVPYRKGSLWGYSDANGKVIIEPVYDKVDIKSIEGQYKVYKTGKAGIIDGSGSVVFEPEFDSIFARYYNPRGHMFFVQKKGLWGLYTHEGKEMVPIKYNLLDKFFFHRGHLTDGKIFMAKKGNEYYIITNEDKVLESGLQAAVEMSHDGVKLKKGNKFALFNLSESRTVTGFEFDSLAMIDQDFDYADAKGKIFYGAIGNKNYAVSIDGKKEELKQKPDLTENGLSVMSSFIELYTQREEITLIAEEVNPDFYSTLRTNGKHEYKPAQIPGWNAGYVIKSNKKQLIGLEGRRGEFFIPPVYGKITVFDSWGKTVVLYNDKKAGLYNYETSTLLIPHNYDAIHDMGVKVLESKGKVGIFDDNGRGLALGMEGTVLIEPAYDKFITRIDLNSRSRSDFYIYEFIDKGKTCYVGSNGVKFFEDSK